jgi:hypothetical protein
MSKKKEIDIGEIELQRDNLWIEAIRPYLENVDEYDGIDEVIAALADALSTVGSETHSTTYYGIRSVNL